MTVVHPFSLLPLHSRGAKVELSGSPDNKPVIITGIDEFGYLRVRDEEGKSLTLHPDGNTFDIMKGLIAMKK